MKITTLLTILGLYLLFQTNSLAQQVKVIDQKGTLKTVTSNTVTISNASPSDPVLSDIWFDTVNNLTKIWDGSSWRAIQAITSKSLWEMLGSVPVTQDLILTLTDPLDCEILAIYNGGVLAQIQAKFVMMVIASMDVLLMEV